MAKAKTMGKAKAKTAMKVMKAKRATKIASGKRAKSSVFRGTKEKTVGGLTKEKLFRNKRGKVVSKAQSAVAKARFGSTLGRWLKAVVQARKELGITGFQTVGGKDATGKALLAKA